MYTGCRFKDLSLDIREIINIGSSNHSCRLLCPANFRDMSSLLSSLLNADALDAALKEVDNEMAFLFETHKVPKEVLGLISSIGFTDLDVWSKFGENQEQVRAGIVKYVGINPEAGPAQRALVARLINCWETASVRSKKKRE